MNGPILPGEDLTTVRNVAARPRPIPTRTNTKDAPIMTLDEYLAQIEAQWLERIEAKGNEFFDEESLFEECYPID